MSTVVAERSVSEFACSMVLNLPAEPAIVFSNSSDEVVSMSPGARGLSSLLVPGSLVRFAREAVPDGEALVQTLSMDPSRVDHRMRFTGSDKVQVRFTSRTVPTAPCMRIVIMEQFPYYDELLDQVELIRYVTAALCKGIGLLVFNTETKQQYFECVTDRFANLVAVDHLALKQHGLQQVIPLIHPDDAECASEVFGFTSRPDTPDGSPWDWKLTCRLTIGSPPVTVHRRFAGRCIASDTKPVTIDCSVVVEDFTEGNAMEETGAALQSCPSQSPSRVLQSFLESTFVVNFRVDENLILVDDSVELRKFLASDPETPVVGLSFTSFLASTSERSALQSAIRQQSPEAAVVMNLNLLLGGEAESSTEVMEVFVSPPSCVGNELPTKPMPDFPKRVIKRAFDRESVTRIVGIRPIKNGSAKAATAKPASEPGSAVGGSPITTTFGTCGEACVPPTYSGESTSGTSSVPATTSSVVGSDTGSSGSSSSSPRSTSTSGIQLPLPLQPARLGLERIVEETDKSSHAKTKTRRTDKSSPVANTPPAHPATSSSFERALNRDILCSLEAVDEQTTTGVGDSAALGTWLSPQYAIADIEIMEEELVRTLPSASQVEFLKASFEGNSELCSQLLSKSSKGSLNLLAAAPSDTGWSDDPNVFHLCLRFFMGVALRNASSGVQAAPKMLSQLHSCVRKLRSSFGPLGDEIVTLEFALTLITTAIIAPQWFATSPPLEWLRATFREAIATQQSSRLNKSTRLPFLYYLCILWGSAMHKLGRIDEAHELILNVYHDMHKYRIRHPECISVRKLQSIAAHNLAIHALSNNELMISALG